MKPDGVHSIVQEWIRRQYVTIVSFFRVYEDPTSSPQMVGGLAGSVKITDKAG